MESLGRHGDFISAIKLSSPKCGHSCNCCVMSIRRRLLHFGYVLALPKEGAISPCAEISDNDETSVALHCEKASLASLSGCRNNISRLLHR